MSASERFYLKLAEPADPALEGRTFQVHAQPDGRLLLYPVTLVPVEVPPKFIRCPVIIGGEQCGDRWGHDGKHMWGRGD